MQNRSHAVMAQRTESKDSLDDFPTPPWATRALIEHVLKDSHFNQGMNCLEPACGAGHMDKVLREYFQRTDAYDIFDYGYGGLKDFVRAPMEINSYDWVITNPPFSIAEEFIARARQIARCGVAMLARTVFIESVGRYERLFRDNPPAYFAQFTERVPMVKGRLDPKASTATGYAWFVWLTGHNAPTKVVWIPPCRRRLEKGSDYDTPGSRLTQVIQRDLFGYDANTRVSEARG